MSKDNRSISVEGWYDCFPPRLLDSGHTVERENT